MFLKGVWGNLKEFMNDYREWHAFVEGFCETFSPGAVRELSGQLLEDLKGEHHYYMFGRVVGYIAHTIFRKVLRMKGYKRP